MQTKVLLVYPEMPVTYWSFRYALPFIGKKSSMPPLGLLTIASLLPKDYQIKLVDMNVSQLKEKDILEADIVFTSSMIVQKKSLKKVIELCNKLGKPVVVGGPYPTSSYDKIFGVNYFVLNEAEITLPKFLNDYQLGKAKFIYLDETKPNITKTPPPRFDLINWKNYSTMALQYSRGCPFSCEFCDIVAMFGNNPRTKTPEQFLTEMQSLYNVGYRGSLFIVDDNFIGNKKNVKKLLPEIISWQKKMDYPFVLFTEASVNLAGDEELMNMMVQAGFNMVFLGIETPVKESLILTHKMQNVKSDLLENVHKIQRKGIEVTAGFIIGFDNDPEDVFDRQIHFIQSAGIPTAMVGLLTAIPKTQLYNRLKAENRLIEESSGNNTHDLRLNFLPKMDVNKLIKGYKRVIAEIYKPEMYFQRCLIFLKNLTPNRNFNRKITFSELRAFILSLLLQTFSFYGWHYWKFIVKAFFVKPKLLSEAITMAIKGHHFFKITSEVLAVDSFKLHLEKLVKSLKERVKEATSIEFEEKIYNISAPLLKSLSGLTVGESIRSALSELDKRDAIVQGVRDLKAYREQVLKELQKEYHKLHKDFQPYVEDALKNFEEMIDEIIFELSGAVLQPVPIKI
jgi:radical SAM superfamily enzyme YgiQ (UPF0313 family)